jgi:hypothetical protein
MQLTAHTPDTTQWWRPARIRRLVRLYFTLQLIQLRTVVEYRGDFWIGILGAVLMHGVGLVFIGALFSRIPEIAGWTVWEVAILYGLTLIPRGLGELFCDGPWTLRAKVNSGEFDRILVRPISPALQAATQLASIHGRPAHAGPLRAAHRREPRRARLDALEDRVCVGRDPGQLRHARSDQLPREHGRLLGALDAERAADDVRDDD